MKPGTIVLTEGNRSSWISRGIARFTGSWITHCFIVVDSERIIEAAFPRVKVGSLQKRMKEMREGKRTWWTAETGPDVVKAALTFEGRWYDFGQLLAFVVTGGFWRDGPGKPVCSRLVTASCFKAKRMIIDAAKVPNTLYRKEQVLKGWVTPCDLLNYSSLAFEEAS